MNPSYAAAPSRRRGTPGSAQEPTLALISRSGVAASTSGCTGSNTAENGSDAAPRSSTSSGFGFFGPGVTPPASVLPVRTAIQKTAASATPEPGSIAVPTPGCFTLNSSEVITTGHNPGSIPTPTPTPARERPTVKLAKLPFYAVDAELVRPAALVPRDIGRTDHWVDFHFLLLPPEISAIRGGNGAREPSQIQLRFCRSPPEPGLEMPDEFPPNLDLLVNGSEVELPKQSKGKGRTPEPVNITPLSHVSSSRLNTVKVGWSDKKLEPNWIVGVWLVRKLSARDILERLKTKGAQDPDVSRRLIIDSLVDDGEVSASSLLVSLACPLGKMRMRHPCRPLICGHVQCFDALVFLEMNERRPTWTCPVCAARVTPELMVLDGYFMRALRLSSGSEEDEIVLQRDGSWKVKALGMPSAPTVAGCISIADD